MKTLERIAFIREIARRGSSIDKTGMMKLLYLLQTLYQVPLAYDFKIYTYGPYCQTVMSDIEYAEFTDYIKISPATYPNGMDVYQINDGNKICNTEILLQYSDAIDEVINFFGGKTAKELELYSTTVFVTLAFRDHNWGESKNDICQAIKKIKPHFSEKVISDTFNDLAVHHYFG